MVNNPNFGTLFEGWGIGKEGFGGGTVNHAWSGGGLTVLSQYLCGIAPANAAYKTILIMPQPGSVKSASAQIASLVGKVSSAFTNSPDVFTLTTSIPAGSKGIIGIPNKGYHKIWLNGTLIWQSGKYLNTANADTGGDNDHIKFKVASGKWNFKAVK
ncbi:MAG: Alpha-L-Rhamnosidase [Mucilaginibacter sp.]|nr:Alpha-L-Rhamnosidase [Mucilaginibacter sp.]